MTDFVFAGTPTDPNLPKAYRDAVLDGANDGVLFLFDLAYRWCWAGGAPANGDAVKDISEHANGTLVEAAGQSVGFSDNGFDFSALTAYNSYLQIPASVAANIWGGGTGPQHFAITLYLTLPAKADWNPLSGLLSFLCFTTAAGGYTSEADLVTIAQSGSGAKTITARRQLTGGSTNTGATVTPKDADFGGVVQLLYWRNAGGQGLRLKSANGVESQTIAPTASNTGDFSGKAGRLGVGPSFWPSSLTSAGAAKDWSIHRGWIENLATSGRDPVSVADADWGRVTGIRGNPFS